MAFLTLTGGSAFTESEAQKLKARINKDGQIAISSIRGSWHYHVHLTDDTAVTAIREQLEQLLPLQDSNQTPPLAHIGYTQTYHVSPRNISPWSSQATSIAQVCGLSQVERIERSRSITVEFEKPHDSHDIPFRDVLYDRMTEHISYEEPDPNQMFAQKERLPLEVVDIFVPGRNPIDVLKDYNQQRGLALDQSEMEYLVEVFTKLGRPPQYVNTMILHIHGST